jgi:lauroyl/myristoyl acyltransferase
LATWLTRVLPLALQLALADVIAAVGWRVLPAMHARVCDNVRHVLGPQASSSEIDRVARKQWRNYLRYTRDFAALPHSASGEIERIFAAAEGWTHIADAMAEGKGLALVSAHFGNWDLAAGTMARHYPVHVIADTFRSGKVDELINQRRHALGVKVIPVEKALKRTISTLRRGEAVAFLVDKPVPGDEGVAVEFFGQQVRVPAGAAYFAKRVGAPLITAFVWRNPDRSFSAKVYPPVPVNADARVTMQRVMQIVEQMVREHPEQWYMFRSMWAEGQRQKANGNSGSDKPRSQDSGRRTSMEEAVA